MTAIPVTGNGPVGFTSTAGGHVTIALSAITYDGSAVNVAYPPGLSTADQQLALYWATYLFQQGELTADTTVTPAPGGAAFNVVATNPGAAGNAIALTIAQVTSASPPYTSTMNLSVTLDYTFSDLTPDNLAARLGTLIPPVPGSDPGPVYVSTVPAGPMLPDDAQQVSLVGGAFTFMNGGSGGTAVFALTPTHSAAPLADEFWIKTAVHGSEFDLILHWKKSTTMPETLAQLASDFADIVTITPPSGSGSYGVPAAGTYPLSNGADQTAVNPQPAKATI